VRRYIPYLVVLLGLAACSSSTSPGHGSVASSPSSAPPPPAVVHPVGFDLLTKRIDVYDNQLKLTGQLPTPPNTSGRVQPGPSDTFVLTAGQTGYVVNLHTGARTSFPLPTDDEFLQHAPPGARVLAFTDSSEHVTLVDPASGRVTDAATLLPDRTEIFSGFARSFTDAFAFVALGKQSDTLVVPYDGSSPYAVGGSVLAMAGRRTLTNDIVSSTRGTDRLAVYDGPKRVANTALHKRIFTGLLRGHTGAVLVTDSGEILTANISTGSTKHVADLGQNVSGAAWLAEDRLLVNLESGSGGPAVLLDGNGHTVATFPAVHGTAVQVTTGGSQPGGRCFVTQPGVQLLFNGGGVVLRDLRTGAPRATFDSSATLLDTPDGCTAATGSGDKAQAALDGRMRTFAGYQAVDAVAPNLKLVVVSGPRTAANAHGWAVLDVASGRATPVDPGVYAFVP
jgi:hypothetical protein